MSARLDGEHLVTVAVATDTSYQQAGGSSPLGALQFLPSHVHGDRSCFQTLRDAKWRKFRG
jgi:hypothetical protein